MQDNKPDASESAQEMHSGPQSQPDSRKASPSQPALDNEKRPPLAILPTLLIALNLVIIGSCVIVVALANGRPIAAWIPRAPAVRPAVLLSLLVAIFGLAQKTIFASGLTIVWWRAQRDHRTTLAHLHHIWSRGTGIGISGTLQALKSSPYVRLVLLAFLAMTAIDLIDGPLLQRSITTVTGTYVELFTPVRLGLPTSLKDGITGRVDNEAPARIFANGTLEETLWMWYKDQPSFYHAACKVTCSGPLRGAGIVANCSSLQRALDIADPSNANETVFSVEMNRTVDSAGAAILEMEHRFLEKPDANCIATLSISRCTIMAATVVYDVVWEGHNVTLNRTGAHPRVENLLLSPGDLPSKDGELAGALAGLEYFGYYYVQSNATLAGRALDGAWGTENSGFTVHRFFDDDFTPQNTSCWLNWENGTDGLLWDLHDVMFRLAWQSTTEDDPWTNSTWTFADNSLTYKSEYRIVGLAAGIMLLGILAVASTFWGFWELDREYSLSPVETGRALAGTLLLSPTGDTNMEIDELLEVIGQKKVQ